MTHTPDGPRPTNRWEAEDLYDLSLRDAYVRETVRMEILAQEALEQCYQVRRQLREIKGER